jgi:alpha/beta superfamily hydrolase
MKTLLAILLATSLAVPAYSKPNNNSNNLIAGIIVGAVIANQVRVQEKKKRNAAAAAAARVQHRAPIVSLRPQPRPSFLCNQDKWFPPHVTWEPTYNAAGREVGQYKVVHPGQYKTITYWCQ